MQGSERLAHHVTSGGGKVNKEKGWCLEGLGRGVSGSVWVGVTDGSSWTKLSQKDLEDSVDEMKKSPCLMFMAMEMIDRRRKKRRRGRRRRRGKM